MNKKVYDKFGFILFFVALIFFIESCASEGKIKSGKGIDTAVDFSSADFFNAEIERINNLIETDLLKALWKSYLISDRKSIDKCSELVVLKFEEFYEAKEFVEAYRYYSAIQAFGYEDRTKYSKSEVFESMVSVVPGLSKSEENESLYPKNISECVEAAVTIFVDKGIKIENGNGYADGVIGSGFFIDKDGYIVTNHHVISDMVDPKYEGFSRLYVKLSSDTDTKIPAKVIGYDSILDLALIKVDIDVPYVFQLGSSSDLAVGDKISAIGTPIGLEGTLTSGIISSVDRKLTTLGNVFQLDAAVNSGNSGGPIVDSNEKVQAVVFAGMLKYQGLNFAIPVEYLKTELPFLYKGGEVSHSWICSYGHTKRNGKEKAGVDVQYVMPGGSAQLSFLQEDDVIIGIQGENVNSIEDLQNVLMKYEPGSLVSCKYIHDGEEKNTIIYLENRPKAPAKLIYQTDLLKDSFIPLYGLKMIPSSTTSSKSYRIIKVLKNSAGDELGFSENDQIRVLSVKMEKDVDYALAEVSTKRRKKGFLDVNLIMPAQVDSPYYF